MDGLLPAIPDATTAPRGILFDVAPLTLRRDMEVTLLERRGNWARIRIGRDDGKQGWVHSSLLKSAVDR